MNTISGHTKPTHFVAYSDGDENPHTGTVGVGLQLNTGKEYLAQDTNKQELVTEANSLPIEDSVTVDDFDSTNLTEQIDAKITEEAQEGFDVAEQEVVKLTLEERKALALRRRDEAIARRPDRRYLEMYRKADEERRVMNAEKGGRNNELGVKLK